MLAAQVVVGHREQLQSLSDVAFAVLLDVFLNLGDGDDGLLFRLLVLFLARVNRAQV